MRFFRSLFLPTLLVTGTLLPAGELSPEITAKLIKLIVNGAGGQGKVGCRDSALKAALEAQGLTIDPAAKVAWGGNPNEIKALKAQGKMVICAKQEWLPQGASIAITEDGGRPKLFLNKAHIAVSGVGLSDDVLKIASF